MFPVSEADFCFVKKNRFLRHSGHKTAAAFVSDFVWGGFGCGVGDAATALRCYCWRRWGSAEGGELKELEVVKKARETGGIGMIIGEILCLFVLQKFP